MAREPKSIQPIAIGQRFGDITVIGCLAGCLFTLASEYEERQSDVP